MISTNLTLALAYFHKFNIIFLALSLTLIFLLDEIHVNLIIL